MSEKRSETVIGTDREIIDCLFRIKMTVFLEPHRYDCSAMTVEQSTVFAMELLAQKKINGQTNLRGQKAPR